MSRGARTLIIFALTLPPGLAAADAGGGAAAAEQARRAARDAGETLREFTLEQRDEAVKHAQHALAELDARMARLAERIEGQWTQLDEAARRGTRETLAALRAERAEAARWIAQLKESPKETWEDVKLGLARSYQALKEKLARTGNAP